MSRKNVGCVLAALALAITLSGCATDSRQTFGTGTGTQRTTGQVFDGSTKVRTSDGHLWTPPTGSYVNKNGSIIDTDGCTIGYTGPARTDGVG